MRHPDHPDHRDRPEPARPPWRDGLVLVCRECEGAKGLDPKLARQVLKHEARDVLGRRSAVIVETGCLDVCPKKAVTVAAVGADGGWNRAVVVRSTAGCRRFIADLADDRRARSAVDPPSEPR